MKTFIKKLLATMSSPLPLREGMGAWLLLLAIGSTATMAQDTTLNDDPFPEVDTHKYADNMTIFGQVRRNGAAVGGSTVVAVYHGDELRGKGTVFSQGRHTDIFLIQVWGDTKGDALVFKVSTGSQLFTVDQGLTYQANAEVGTPTDYYYIDLPSSAPGEAVEQTLTLKKGWNWVAGFLQEPLSVSAMASACSRIQSQTHEVVSDPLYGMTGPLTALLPGVGYKIKVSEDCTCTFSGHVCNPADISVNLQKGWNWIGYPLLQAASPAAALAGLQAALGDRLLSQDKYAEYGTDGWQGTLRTLEPGKAYMYFRAAGATTFTYPY